MAKQKRLNDDWHEKIPKPVQDKADEYQKLLRDRNRLNGKLNACHESTLEVMEKHGISRLVIGDGLKVLEIEERKKLKIKKRVDQESNGESNGESLAPRRRKKKGEAPEPKLAEQTA